MMEFLIGWSPIILPSLLLLGLIYWLIRRTVDNQKHWQHLFVGMQFSAEEFYKSVQENIAKKKIEGLKFSRVTYSQKRRFGLGGSREYLHIEKNEFIYDVCAAPFGDDFFVSMWYAERHSVTYKILHKIPLLKNFVETKTYYGIDTDGMIKSAINAGFDESVEELTTSKGVRMLTESERKLF